MGRCCSLLLAAIAVTGYWWYALVWLSFSTDASFVRVHFLDVGQGDAILIETPNGRRALIDAGRDWRVISALDGVLPPGDATIDVAVMTHPDADHIGGFAPVFNQYNVSTVVHSSVPPTTALARTIMDMAADEVSDGGRMHRVTEPNRFLLDGVAFLILWPVGESVRERNAASVILLIRYGSTDVLLTGDAPAAVEDLLPSLHPGLIDGIEIVKAGHHGSRTSLSPNLLARAAPAAVVFSYGADNRYGHPHRSIVSRVASYLEAAPTARAYRTVDGTVSFCLAKDSFVRC